MQTATLLKTNEIKRQYEAGHQISGMSCQYLGRLFEPQIDLLIGGSPQENNWSGAFLLKLINLCHP